MNMFINELSSATNLTQTENGATTHKSTKSALLDLFALGAAYRSRTDEKCVQLFMSAFMEDPTYALKCLFYIRDVRGGQGERRFFRICMKALANRGADTVEGLIELIPEYGRWDDLYLFVGTPAGELAFKIMHKQFELDMKCQTPSLLGKWLKSENTSSKESRKLGAMTRKAFNLTPRQYRQALSALRKKINVLECLMSAGRWDEIEFDKIPSRAGMIYRNAFARNDIIGEKYAAFAKKEDTTVNAKALYPYECVEAALRCSNETDRLMINKYWDNLADYFNGQSFSAMPVVDVSGSMRGTPMNVAISIGMYCATRNQGAFANNFITFSQNPDLVTLKGDDFVDQVTYMSRASWGYSTNIEAVFALMKQIALSKPGAAADMPENLIIVSDMEFDDAVDAPYRARVDTTTLLENIADEWEVLGLAMPHLVFWNVNARNDNIPVLGRGRVSYVSGFSPVIFETLLSGKSGYDLMMEKLNTARYARIK